ncbi:MAG: protein kinase [Acidobacteria bacterium]|nr:protein kinase [Acidobacteriota bacterium]
MDVGAHLNHYTIIAKLGEGGMGQVFRAEDTTLRREVAIKVLPPEVAGDPDRMRRLEREAQLLAQLNHPNIAAIHGLEDAGGIKLLVMQLAEGRNLHERLEAGPVALAEALAIALQIARALESAHDKGVVHRDLKPANVMVADDGTVKLLDFGLAKLFTGESSGSASRVSESPTELATTQPGIILGTAGYMSPEQARGRTVDRRTDIWAFGCVLYEMLTAQRTFAGETMTDVLGAIVHREPNWDLLPAGTPRRIRALLHRCLRKDASRRIQAIGDARVTIEEYIEDPQAAEAILDAGAGEAPAWRAYLPWAAAGVLALALAATLLWPGAKTLAAPTLRLDMAGGGADDLRDLSLGSSLVLSPDGSQIIIATGNNQESRLQIRRLDSTNANTLTGGGTYNPFFSPDGAWVGFALPTSIEKVPATGGTPLKVVGVDRSRGADWGPDGRIVYAPSPASGLMSVSADGGEPTPVTTLDESTKEATHRWPQFLPGGRRVLFTAHVAGTGGFDAASLKVVDLDTGVQTVVYRGGYYGRDAESGHLLFVNEGTLFAVPFDPDRLELVGSVAPVAEGVADDPGSGGAQYSVSKNGVLVHRRGSSGPGQYAAVWLNREGQTTTLLPEARTYVEARVSPDGRRVAMTELNGGNWDVWVYDLDRGTRTRLTFADGIDGPAVWSPDSSELIYSSDADGSDDLWRKAADGSGEAVQLTHEDVQLFVSDWSSDGRYLLALRGGAPDEAAGWAGGADIAYIDLSADQVKVLPFLATRFQESEAAFSPDRRWVAYQSNESGRVEVYVRPFPPAGGRWQVSDEGGAYARWAADGRELYYRTDEGIMMVTIANGPTFSASRPRLLASGNFMGGLTGVSVTGTTFADYDVAPDGRFVMFPNSGDEAPNIQLARVVVNWFPELRRLVPRR